MTNDLSLQALAAEYDTALGYTDALWQDLSQDETHWRPNENSSAIAWHLGHQAAVAHFMIRNLTAAEPSPDPELDGVMDSATAETQRGDLPELARIGGYRDAVAERVRFRVGEIDAGRVGAPEQLVKIAETMLTAIINHEYQHAKWVGEVRVDQFNKPLPAIPDSQNLKELDGYLMI